MGLNRRAPNVVAPNETGRLPLKYNIFLSIINFWLHLETLPENSVARQCLHISNQVANNGKSSFMSTINELLKQYYLRHHRTPQSIDHVTDKQIIKNHLLKIKQLNTSSLKTHQMEMIRCNKKLNFYFMFKTEVSKSEYLELIKNMTHRKALAKLRSGNHNLRIESGRHCIPKIPENL